MSKTVTTTITVTTAGDGESHTDTYVITNTSGVPPTQVGLATGTNTNVNVPAGAIGMWIQAPATGTLLLKGVSGDTGVSINTNQWAVVFFAPGLATITLQQSTGQFQAIPIIWL